MQNFDFLMECYKEYPGGVDHLKEYDLTGKLPSRKIKPNITVDRRVFEEFRKKHENASARIRELIEQDLKV